MCSAPARSASESAIETRLALAENRDLTLRLVLRVLGSLDFCALAAVFAPYAWLASVHARLGLGPFPPEPVVEYLARTVSCLYALHGAAIILLSSDVDRYRPLIRFLAWAAVAHGVLVLGIDLAAELPQWWVFCEGPSIVASGLLVLWLERRGRLAYVAGIE